MNRRDPVSSEVYRRALERMPVKQIAKALGKAPSTVRHHLRKLVVEHALEALPGGLYKEGRNGLKYAWPSNSPPSAQTVAPNSPPSPLRRVTGARFRMSVIRNSGGPFPTSYEIANGVSVFQKRLRLREDIWGTVQAWNSKTLMLSMDDFHLTVEAIPKVNEYLWSLAYDATRKLSKDLGASLSIPEPIPDPKAKDATLPLLTGEICDALPLPRTIRVAVSPTAEVNNSPPGPAWETADILEAHVQGTLPSRVIALEKMVGGVAEALKSQEAALLKMAEGFESQARQFILLAETLRKMMSPEAAPPVPEPPPGAIGGYA